jgi:uncharacterized membrane protein YbhN (UPF0104 family)
MSVRALLQDPRVRFALTPALLALVLLKVRPQQVGASLAAAQPSYLVAAVLLTIPFLLLKSLRWYLMLRAARVDATFWEGALSLLGGMGLALLTPARLGELVRVAYLRDPRKLEIGALVMVDKSLDVVVLAALSVAGGWALLGPPVGLALAVAALAGAFILYNGGLVSRQLVKLSARLPSRGRLERVWLSLRSLNPRATTVYLSLTLLSFVVVLLQFAIILQSWHSPSPLAVLLTFPLVILTNVLPITIGGLGVREGAAALLLAHFGVSAADAALAAFLMFAINTALPGILGSLLLPAALPASGRRARSLDRP